jgi:hypothetical protein
MKLFIHMLIWAMPTVLLVGGCSKKKAPEEISDGPDEIGEETVALPKQTKPKSIARLDDGLWHENADGKIFTGTIVHEEDSLRWEEKYDKGVRVFVRAWDEDGSSVPLHSWNADGSPAN